MKRIEGIQDMINWDNEVNTPCANIPDLQDIFARSDMNSLHTYFMDLTQNGKELTIFAISKAMGSATLFEFIKTYSHHKAQEYIEAEGQEVDQRWGDLVQKEFDFKNEKERLILTIKNLEHQNAELVKDNDKTNKQCSDYYRRIITLESNEEDYEAEIKELRSFECHIKGLLTEAA